MNREKRWIVKRLALLLLLAAGTALPAVGQDGARPEPPVRAVETAIGGLRYAVHTNAVWLGLGVLNLGVEVAVARHFSVSFPVSYSPYRFSRRYRLQVLALQPELRYWIDAPFRGHFFGFHLHTGKFNIALNDHRRYQDNRWLAGCGLSYGYSLPFARRWNAEFTAGAGYARLNYDIFYNVPNGARFDSRRRNYWGLTRAGIVLSYRFGFDKR